MPQSVHALTRPLAFVSGKAIYRQLSSPTAHHSNFRIAAALKYLTVGQLQYGSFIELRFLLIVALLRGF